MACERYFNNVMRFIVEVFLSLHMSWALTSLPRNVFLRIHYFVQLYMFLQHQNFVLFLRII